MVAYRNNIKDTKIYDKALKVVEGGEFTDEEVVIVAEKLFGGKDEK